MLAIVGDHLVVGDFLVAFDLLPIHCWASTNSMNARFSRSNDVPSARSFGSSSRGELTPTCFIIFSSSTSSNSLLQLFLDVGPVLRRNRVFGVEVNQLGLDDPCNASRSAFRDCASNCSGGMPCISIRVDAADDLECHSCRSPQIRSLSRITSEPTWATMRVPLQAFISPGGKACRRGAVGGPRRRLGAGRRARKADAKWPAAAPAAAEPPAG